MITGINLLQSSSIVFLGLDCQEVGHWELDHLHYTMKIVFDFAVQGVACLMTSLLPLLCYFHHCY